MDKLHILFGNIRKVFFEFFKSFLRIMSQKYRVGEPCDVPCPVVQWIIEAEIHLPCRLDILRRISIRICDTTCRGIAYLDWSSCIFS